MGKTRGMPWTFARISQAAVSETMQTISPVVGDPYGKGHGQTTMTRPEGPPAGELLAAFLNERAIKDFVLVRSDYTFVDILYWT